MTVSATVSAAPITGISRNVPVTYATAQTPPSQPHHGAVRNPESRGRGVPRVASSTASTTEIVTAATAKLTSATAIGSCSAARRRALTAPWTGRAAPASTPRRSQPGAMRWGSRGPRTTAVMPASTASVPATIPAPSGRTGVPNRPNRSIRTDASTWPVTNNPPAASAPRRGNSRMPLVM